MAAPFSDSDLSNELINPICTLSGSLLSKTPRDYSLIIHKFSLLFFFKQKDVIRMALEDSTRLCLRKGVCVNADGHLLQIN